MFCDQDDVWDKNKVKLSIDQLLSLEEKSPNTPILIYTDLIIVDEELNIIENSFFKYQNVNPLKTDLNNLLVQNVATGCTITINKELLNLASPVPKNAIMHDWWLVLIAKTQGIIYYLPTATIKYRQHTNNSIGSQKFDISLIIKKIFKKNILHKHIKQAKLLLKYYNENFSNNDLNIVNTFISIENKNYFIKIYYIFRYKFFLHGIVRNIGLILKI
jgi:hypothetical protein